MLRECSLEKRKSISTIIRPVRRIVPIRLLRLGLRTGSPFIVGRLPRKQSLRGPIELTEETILLHSPGAAVKTF